MRSKKGAYVKILKDPAEGCFLLEMGSDFDCFRIAVDFVDLITLKNEIEYIEEQAKRNERGQK